jgi:hypothetical protein
LAIIIRAASTAPAIEFLTAESDTFQLGRMRRPKDYVIAPHVHRSVERRVVGTPEVLFVKKGKVRIDFFSEDKTYLQSRVVASGDVILLAAGGHGFKMLEESELIEVKQGPYLAEQDKNRFEMIADARVVIR